MSTFQNACHARHRSRMREIGAKWGAKMCLLSTLAMISACDSQKEVSGPDADKLRAQHELNQKSSGLAPLLEMENTKRLRGRYIVRFKADMKNTDIVSRDMVTRHQGKVYKVMPGLNAFWGELSDAAVERLREDPRVRYIEADVSMPLAGIGDTTQYSANNSLDRMDQRLLPLSTTYEYSSVGTGVHIWIVDNGVDMYDAQLSGRVSTTIYSTYNAQNPLESCAGSGHGTLMAVAAAGSTQGVARNATIHSARVNEVGNCTSLSTGATSSAMEFIADYSPRPAVINYSASRKCWSGPGCGFTVDDAVNYAHNHGVTVVVSAGNGDNLVAENACNYTPAHESNAITVAASDFSDVRQSYSNYGSCVDLFAPVDWGGGTSTAAALTSGVAALFLQLYPSASPASVASEIIGKTTYNAISSAGSGTPNRLLYSRVPILQIAIDGPTFVGPSTFCSWYAVRSGGQPPFTLEWRRDNSVVSTSDSYTSGFNATDFWLELKVTDGVGRYTYASPTYVTVDPNNTTIICN